MKIKIDENMVCIPPHISTGWEKIAYMESKKDNDSSLVSLILHLTNGNEVRIPDLDPSIVEIAFSAHMKYMENEHAQKNESRNKLPLQNLLGLSPEQMGGFPLKFALGNIPPELENLEMSFQHNQQAANSPSLPHEVIEKITQMARIMTNGDLTAFPKPEPHCNCMHCQIARAIHEMEQGENSSASSEEDISEEDLSFREWDIAQSGKNLYTVTNPLDPDEHYNVFLGSPLGCTCGQQHCEHIRAVLSS